MKKIIVTILSVFYLLAATGTTVHLHYCMGKLASWGFWENAGNQCGKCGMDKKNSKKGGCCNDDFRIIKLDKDQKISESSIKFIQFSSLADNISFTLLPEINIVFLVTERPGILAPPRSTGTALYIRNCVFLI